ncbi:unnamed protein product [Vitrella brassicaformis CCMP3155]|uniref:Integrase catalytic domain-containing protein n=1 Tax=Vitrella brassicaformis (strain CCMP3155) TaxID=1169540 RepID=A0A0G4H138_VITBC|nr:unnamed protein product [Vitrella brassicaformis CCMP3155]|eukprot:CEM37262.1 unnamed protein product [Vitrella brassicaformis CCMP3155]
MEAVVVRHGLPEEILTDNGSHFVNQLMREVTTRLRIKHTTITPMHPQGNGMIERFNRTLKDRIRPYLNKKQTNWDRVIPLFLYAYRTTEHESTGFTPFKMLTGREAVHPGSTARLVAMNETAAKTIDPDDAVKLIVEGIQAIHKEARKNMDRAKQQVAARESDLPAPREFKSGDRVRIFNDQAATSSSEQHIDDERAVEVSSGLLRRDRRQTVFNQDAFLTPDQDDLLKDFAVGQDRVPAAKRDSEGRREGAAGLGEDDLCLGDIQPDPRFEKGVVHEVEAIVGKRTHRGKVQYKLKWRWYPLSHATWEDESSLSCRELVQDYENRESGSDLRDDSLLPALYSTVRIRHVKELTREHTVKVTRLDKDGIELHYLREPTRTKRLKKQSLVGMKCTISLADFLRFFQWEKERDECEDGLEAPQQQQEEDKPQSMDE